MSRYSARMKWAAALLGVGIFSAGTSIGRYYLQEFDERYQTEVKKRNLAKDEILQKPVNGVFDTIRWMRRIDAMEKYVSEKQDGGEIAAFAERNKKYLKDMTSSDIEKYGYLATGDYEFQLIERPTPKKEAIQYMQEALAADFRNLKSLQDMIANKKPELGLGYDDANGVIIALAVINNKRRYDTLSEYDRKNFSIEFTSTTGPFHMPMPDFENKYRIAREYLALSIPKIKGGVPGTFDKKDMQNSRIFSRWHTHPVNDPEYMPSAPDEANSFLNGPNILFSQNKGMLHVYVIKKGQSTEVYTTSLVEK